MNGSGDSLIRLATPYDVHHLIALGERARSENSTDQPPIDHKRIYDMASQWFLLPELCCALVAESDHEVVGMLVSSMTENLWSGDRSAVCHTLYATKQHRNKAPYLVKGWLKWCKRSNAKSAHLIIDGEHNFKLETLLRVLGFHQDGTRFRVTF